MNPIKFCLNITAAIILAPLIPIVALAWLAVWLPPKQQSASVANPQVRGDVAPKRFTVESEPTKGDSVFSFAI